MNAAVRLVPPALLLAATLAPAAAQPRLLNTQHTARDVAGTLDATVRALAAQAAQPAWIAWQTPAVPRRGDDDGWCWSDGEPVRFNRLEPPDTLFVFLRVEHARIDRVRTFDDRCPIDAGERPVTWLRTVRPEESVALLSTLAADRSAGTRVSRGALAALAQHAGPAAVQPLLQLARRAQDPRLRGEAIFWLSQRAGREAAAAITDAVANDPETAVKKRAVFALSQLPADEGVPRLVEVARTHENPAVRKQAIFWLGQSKDPRALTFFEEILK